MRTTLLAFLASLLLIARSSSEAAPARLFQKVENCQYKADRWNDGDSFHILTGDEKREVVVRLYFVDTPEAGTAYNDRLDEQAAYFEITRDQATQIAKDASAFTKDALSKPFTIQTQWRSALGRSALGRIYAFVYVEGKTDLNELLVANGLARIYGTRTALPAGSESPAYLARLTELEAQAKREKKGAWRY